MEAKRLGLLVDWQSAAVAQSSTSKQQWHSGWAARLRWAGTGRHWCNLKFAFNLDRSTRAGVRASASDVRSTAARPGQGRCFGLCTVCTVCVVDIESGMVVCLLLETPTNKEIKPLPAMGTRIRNKQLQYQHQTGEGVRLYSDSRSSSQHG